MSFKLQPGINNCSNDDYHADKSYLSSSQLKTLLKSAEQFAKEQVTPSAGATRTHLELGTYVHSLLLEPHLVAEQYAIFPGFRRAGEHYEIFKRLNPNKLILSAATDNLAQRMVASAMHDCAPLMDLLSGGEAEQSIALVLSDVRVKARFDYVNFNAAEAYILDLKTSREPAGKEHFKQTIKQFRYDLSAALYVAVAQEHYQKPFSFYWGVLSKEDIECRVYKASAKTMNIGEANCIAALQKYKKCLSTGIWLDDSSEECNNETSQDQIEEI